MSDYTPTTEEIRRAVTSFNEYFDHPRAAEFDGDLFDRWLDEVKADAWDEGWLYNVDDRIWSSLHDNPYREID